MFSKEFFCGEGVIFDGVNPSGITIEDNVVITANTIILSHYIDSTTKGLKFRRGDVLIKENAFIGAGSIICNSVVIGENAIVGSGSVVTKNIPANEVWAGNPARFIKRRNNL